jgi:hypothetical protein
MTKPLNPVPETGIPLWDEYSWDNQETWNEFLAPVRHPILPAGINSACWNGDEFNGAGVEEPLWPDAFTATEMYWPSLVGESDMAVFDCVDLSIKAVDNCIAIRPEDALVTIRGKPCHRRS